MEDMNGALHPPGFVIHFAGTPTRFKEIKIGVIIDEVTQIGKEQKIAVTIAAQQFNNDSNHLKLSLLFRSSSSEEPFEAVSFTQELATNNGVKAIIGMETWQQAALAAQVGKNYQIPVLSLAPFLPAPPLSSERWPFLIQIATNYMEHIKGIVSIVRNCGWKRIIAVYEDDGHAGISQKLTLLSQALQPIGSEIEYNLALPPIRVMSSHSNNPGEVVLGELAKVLFKQSRVFIVLESSLPVAWYLFKAAKKIGLMGRETAWIVTESIAGLMDSVNSTFISNMEGVLGVRSYYTNSGKIFLDFQSKFLSEFRTQYPEEGNLQAGIYALRAYDGMTAIISSIKNNLMNNKTEISSVELLRSILSRKFQGLSGDISFNDQGELLNHPPRKVMNVVGRSYKEWELSSPEFIREIGWPGGEGKHIPKGFAMPMNAKPLRIGIPLTTSYDNFVKLAQINISQNPFSGFSIDVFLEVVKYLEQSYFLPYELVPFNGSYDDLVCRVSNGTFDAADGDVTITAKRSKIVDFTQPYANSGIVMVAPFKSKEGQKAWLFLKPFTWEMWAVTGVTLLYTMFVVWFLEHPSNPEFGGTWRNQVGAALWFTFTSIFFAQRERIQSNYTRTVVGVWLVVVFVLTQNYMACFTSVLTVKVSKPEFHDVSWLINTNQKVGCGDDAIVRTYLTAVLGFENDSVITFSTEQFHTEYFINNGMVVGFLELPYARIFLDQYCKGFTRCSHTYSLAGLGFVFPKGSTMAEEVSKAILYLSHYGILKSLDDKWFSPLPECKNAGKVTEQQLSIYGFWVLFLVSGVISTFSLLLFLARFFRASPIHPGSADFELDEQNVLRERAES